MNGQGSSHVSRSKYDRQIELLGKDTQKKLADTAVFVECASRALSETAKNVVLSGFGKICLEACGEKELEGLKEMNKDCIVSKNQKLDSSYKFAVFTPKTIDEYLAKKLSLNLFKGLQIYLFEWAFGGVILLGEGEDLSHPTLEGLKKKSTNDACLKHLLVEGARFNDESFGPLSMVLGSLVNQIILLRMNSNGLTFNTLAYNFAEEAANSVSLSRSCTYFS